MTESDSNSLRRELAAIPRVGEHPDADVLNAFAEGALLERERNAVMAHLAGCAECREVLSLIAEEAPQTDAEVKQFPAREAASCVDAVGCGGGGHCDCVRSGGVPGGEETGVCAGRGAKRKGAAEFNRRQVQTPRFRRREARAANAGSAVGDCREEEHPRG